MLRIAQHISHLCKNKIFTSDWFLNIVLPMKKVKYSSLLQYGEKKRLAVTDQPSYTYCLIASMRFNAYTDKQRQNHKRQIVKHITSL